MAAKSLTVLFTIGKFLTITPPYNAKVSLFQKVYTFIFITFTVVISTLSISNRRYYAVEIYAKVTVNFIIDLLLLVFSCYVPLNVVLWKREKWHKLLDNLNLMVSTSKNSDRIVRNVRISIAKLGIDLVIVIVEICFWCHVFGFTIYVRQFNVHYIEFYLINSYNVFLSLILSLILIQYQHLNAALGEHFGSGRISSHKFPIVLNKIENNLFFLKDLVNLFNNIFGWPIAIIISYTTIFILNNFDYIFKTTVDVEEISEKRILADVVSVLLVFLGTATVIAICDLILKEAEDILAMSYTLRRNAKSLSPKDKEHLKHFTKMILQNFPKFSAARFFNIDRSTILNMLGTVTTFFIILIQFRSCTLS
ncbi:putative gustatory receptor 39b [Tenebrio molitor]|uniref:putative gustatory receptor 39b n=1 Tax=Tenebrio molitor TaxID=7067 RepID=UPI00362499D8